QDGCALVRRERAERLERREDLGPVDAGDGIRGGLEGASLETELVARDPERGSVDPRQGLADLLAVLDGARERLGDGGLGDLPPPPGKRVDRAGETGRAL